MSETTPPPLQGGAEIGLLGLVPFAADLGMLAGGLLLMFLLGLPHRRTELPFRDVPR